ISLFGDKEHYLSLFSAPKVHKYHFTRSFGVPLDNSINLQIWMSVHSLGISVVGKSLGYERERSSVENGDLKFATAI
ncbi:hypothetical protein C0J52_11025, partial [Blattella germanica]